MQRLLEKTPHVGYGGIAVNRSKLTAPRYAVAFLLSIAAAAYVAFFVLPRLSLVDDDYTSGSPRAPSDASAPPVTSNHRSSAASIADPSSVTSNPNGDAPMLEPWGYNKDRNVPRWLAIHKSIASDKVDHFSLVDYGADQGYFSVSVSKWFPGSLVMGLEMGGVGGEIWNKGKKQMDVLSIQESHLERLGLHNMLTCQTMMHPSHFFKLKERHARSDYQLMLSVFHWFDLPTRKDFEEAIVVLFSNARTTFIELPTIGDNSALIRKQVGYKNFAAWYDGRADIKQILLDAASSQGAEIRVSLVLSSPWLQWTREVYRVDFLGSGGHAQGAETSSSGFQCAARREIYGCKPREKFSTCPSE